MAFASPIASVRGVFDNTIAITSSLLSYFRNTRDTGTFTAQTAIADEAESLRKLLKQLLGFIEDGAFDLIWVDNSLIYKFQKTHDELVGSLLFTAKHKISEALIQRLDKAEIYGLVERITRFRKYAVEFLQHCSSSIDLSNFRHQDVFLLIAEELPFEEVYIAANGAKFKATWDDAQVGFIVATYAGDIQEAERLLALGENKNETYMQLGLFLAVERSNSEMLRLLLSAGIDVNAKNRDGQTPLHRATHRCSTEIMKILIENGADVEARNKDCETPWSANVGSRKDSVLSVLLKAGANPNTKGWQGVNPIYGAAAIGNSDLIRFMLQSGTDPSILTNFGWAPLHWAACHGHLDCVKLLIEAGADLSPMSDQKKTPLDLAMENKRTAVIDMLVESRAQQALEDTFELIDLQVEGSEAESTLAGFDTDMLTDTETDEEIEPRLN